MATHFSKDRYACAKDMALSVPLYLPLLWYQLKSCLLFLRLEKEKRRRKVVTANSRAKAAEVKSSRLRKDLIEATDQANKAKAMLKKVSNQLKIEKMLVIKKDEEIQSTMLKINDVCEKAVVEFQVSETFCVITFDEFLKGFELLRCWTMKHHSNIVDYSNLNFKAIDKEMMVDEDAKKARSSALDQVGLLNLDPLRCLNGKAMKICLTNYNKDGEVERLREQVALLQRNVEKDKELLHYKGKELHHQRGPSPAPSHSRAVKRMLDDQNRKRDRRSPLPHGKRK
nr:hypothetical protein CFP56_65367 [Quercus suber]